MESAPNNDELNIPPLITPTSLDIPAAAQQSSSVPMRLDKQGNVNLDVIPTEDVKKYGEMGKDLKRQYYCYSSRLHNLTTSRLVRMIFFINL